MKCTLVSEYYINDDLAGARTVESEIFKMKDEDRKILK